jgi:hypothetical protein
LISNPYYRFPGQGCQFGLVKATADQQGIYAKISGTGPQLDASISTLTWTQVSLILLVILATVIVSEWVSAKIRHAII